MNYLKLLLRGHYIRALSSTVRPTPHQAGPVLTSDLRHHLSHILEEYHALQDKASALAMESGGREHDHQLYQRISSLEPVVKLVRHLETKELEIKELRELLDGSSEEEGLKSLAREEEHTCNREIQRIQESLLRALIPRDAADQNSAILEVRAGAGGKEAALFTADIFQMYQKFAAFKRWIFEALEMAVNEAGGLKHASASVTGSGVFGMMKHESGVHRVQRIPTTEGSGRIHTSTMSVAILPQPTEIEVTLNPNDLRVETHRSSGPGGQSVNTTDSAVRLTHIPTGLVVHIQDDRSQHKNRSRALQILRARLYELRRTEAELAMRKERKQQIGSGERHERIRTYQFLQDRMTDHRLGVSIHGLEEFMEGRDTLESIMEQLQAAEEVRAISTLLADHRS